jgi:hypothetical protein
MDGLAPIECSCGSQNIERVVVQRPGGDPYRADLVACAECR